MSIQFDSISQPAALAELITLQPGSVVSRVILKNGSGSLTLFAFDEGAGLSEHETPHEAAVLVIEGSLDVTIAGDRHTVMEGQALHLPASVPHALQATAPLKMLLVMLKEGG